MSSVPLFVHKDSVAHAFMSLHRGAYLSTDPAGSRSSGRRPTSQHLAAIPPSKQLNLHVRACQRAVPMSMTLYLFSQSDDFR